jgi:hypothetical protein
MTELASLGTTLNTPLNAMLERHRADILRKFSCGDNFSSSFVANEELVRRVADYSYEFLPWPVRLAIKKPAFVDFVAAHRVAVLARLTVAPPA